MGNGEQRYQNILALISFAQKFDSGVNIGLTSFIRYIDKIIYEWGKKGIKTPQDVANNRLKFKEKQEKKEKLELFDYDWFEDGEDEENWRLFR